MNEKNNALGAFLLVIIIAVGIVFLFSKLTQGSVEETQKMQNVVSDDNSATPVKINLTPQTSDTPANSPQQLNDPSVPTKYVATLNTSKGDVAIQLNSDQTPKTVLNFVTLAKKNFYDKTTFHRVIKGFMIQGGDPTGTGSGGPGYSFDDEPFTGEYTRGTVAMANAGPNTNGSQFFIMHADNTGMPKNYTIFGRVISGMDVVDAIANDQVTLGGDGAMSKPINPTVINSVVVKESK